MNFHQYGAKPAHLEVAEGPPHYLRHLIGESDFFRPFRHWRVGLHRAKKMKNLRRVARVADRQQENWHRIRISRADAGECVLGARTSLHGENTDALAIGDACEAVGDPDAYALL